MKLIARKVSPYTRKVRVLAIERGIEDRFETVMLQSTEEHRRYVPAFNPLGKVPVFIMDDGLALIDSPVICEFLDTIEGGDRFFPEDGEARWRALQYLAIGDGITDAALEVFFEMHHRPEGTSWRNFYDQHAHKVVAGLDALEENADAFLSEPLHIGHLSVACAIGYVNFRLPKLNLDDGRPRLFRWYSEFSARPSMQRTRPDLA